MSTTSLYFSNVTLLITHYNRSSSLERLLKTFKELGCVFGDIVVSDDGSKTEHFEEVKNLKSQYVFQLVSTEKNKGLGNNINKGQDAVKTPFTLYIQEDFVPNPIFTKHLTNALSIMEGEDKWDIVRFYSYFRYPYLKHYKKGFSEMLFKSMPWYNNHLKFYYYSDHPHLRRSDFSQKFGRYVEGRNVDYTEFQMCLSFIKNHGRGLVINDFKNVFMQCNNSSEPSTASYRPDWRLSRMQHVIFLRWIYLKFRFVKNTFQLFFMKLQLL